MKEVINFPFIAFIYYITQCWKLFHNLRDVYDFMFFFYLIFSYGFRYTTGWCLEGVFMMCIQCVTAFLIQSLVAGMVVAKIAKPQKRSQTIIFSRYALVCLRDDKLCLMWRIANIRKSHIIGAQISALIIREKKTLEGEIIPYYHTKLDVSKVILSNEVSSQMFGK